MYIHLSLSYLLNEQFSNNINYYLKSTKLDENDYRVFEIL